MNHEGSSGWYVVEEARRVTKKPLSLTRLGTRIVLWRDGEGALHAHGAACPHRGVDLGAGRVVRGTLECPYHGFRFDGAGQCVAMPCEGAAKTPPPGMRLQGYPALEERGFVWVYFGDAPNPLPPLPWPDAMPAMDRRSCTRPMTWSVPHAAVMEAMLDLHHAPHAHRLLSPGFGARLDPYHVRREAGALHVEGWLRHDTPDWDGKSGTRMTIEARPPGVVFIALGDWVEGVVFVTPIDRERTHILVRYFVPRVPILGAFLAWLALVTELRLVQPDDERMQRLTLRDADDLSTCTLVRADASLIEWRRLLAKPRARSRAEAGAPDA